MSVWYTSLESQLRQGFYDNLIKIVQSSPEDWRNLTVVSDLAAMSRKPTRTHTKSAQSPTNISKKGNE